MRASVKGDRKRASSLAAALLAGLAPMLLHAPALRAQQGANLDALKHGKLVVWVVKPSPPKTGTVPHTPLPLTLQEQTAGSFGQAAGSVGTSASNYGVSSSSDSIARVPANVPAADPNGTVATAAGYREQTSGSYGQTSGSFGTAASNHGQTAGSLGQSAGNYGTAASDYGQSAGSFGRSLNTLADAGQTPAPRPFQDQMEPKLRAAYPGLQVKFISVEEDRLRQQLRGADVKAPADGYPDVLIFDGFSAYWSGPSPEVRDLAGPSTQSLPSMVRGLVLAKGPHTETAREFLSYVNQLAVTQNSAPPAP